MPQRLVTCLHRPLGQHGHGVGVKGGQVVLVRKNGQLGAGQHAAVAALGEQVLVDGGEFLGVAVPTGLHVVVDQGHNQLLGLRRGDHSLDSGGGTFPLVQPGPDGAVGGQDAGALQSLGGQQPGGLPDHVEDGDADILLHPVQEEVGGVAGHGDAGTPRLLQQLGVCQQPLKDRVLGLSSA